RLRSVACFGERLNHQASCPPLPRASAAALPRLIVACNGEPQESRKLLRLPEIGERRLAQNLAFERDNALVTVHVPALAAGERKVPATQKHALLDRSPTGGELGEALLVVARVPAHAAAGVEIHDEEINEAVGFGLHDELAGEFQRGTQHG